MKKTLALFAALALAVSAFAVEIGKPAPDFTLYQLNGQKVTLSSLRGRPVLVDFWGST